MADTKCTGDHSVHICERAQQDKFNNIKTLAQYPYYLCINRGRVADSEKNLCNPMVFDKIPDDIAG